MVTHTHKVTHAPIVVDLVLIELVSHAPMVTHTHNVTHTIKIKETKTKK